MIKIINLQWKTENDEVQYDTLWHETVTSVLKFQKIFRLEQFQTFPFSSFFWRFNFYSAIYGRHLFPVTTKYQQAYNLTQT